LHIVLNWQTMTDNGNHTDRYSILRWFHVKCIARLVCLSLVEPWAAAAAAGLTSDVLPAQYQSTDNDSPVDGAIARSCSRYHHWQVALMCLLGNGRCPAATTKPWLYFTLTTLFFGRRWVSLFKGIRQFRGAYPVPHPRDNASVHHQSVGLAGRRWRHISVAPPPPAAAEAASLTDCFRLYQRAADVTGHKCFRRKAAIWNDCINHIKRTRRSETNCTVIFVDERLLKQVVKVISHKVPSPSRTNHLSVFARWRQCAPLPL